MKTRQQVDENDTLPCETCGGDGWVEDRSGNFPDRPGINAGPFIEKMECPTCNGTGWGVVEVTTEHNEHN